MTNWPTHRLVDLGGLCCCAAYAVLTQASWSTQQVPLTVFFSVMGLAWAVTLGLFAVLSGKERGRSASVRRLLAWAIVFRLLGLAADPVLEDDPYRYLWDGYRMLEQGDPYSSAPADFFADETIPEPMQAVLDRINHPDIPTLYGPTSQLVFAASAWLALGEVAPVKILLVVIDIAALLFLSRRLSLRGLLLLAWCPLLIKEVAFTGHVDGMGASLVAVALFLAHAGRPWLAGLLLGFAIGTKPLALLAVAPMLLIAETPQRAVQAMLATAATSAALYGPFVTLGAGGAGLDVFARQWEFNSTVYALLSQVFGDTAARGTAAGLFVVFYLGFLGGAARHAAWRWRLDVVFGVLFLLSPVANAWYLLWMLPFVALHPSGWGIGALVGVTLAYAHGQNFAPAPGGRLTALGAYGHPIWVRPLELATIVAGGLLGGRISGTDVEGERDGHAEDVLHAGVPPGQGAGVE